MCQVFCLECSQQRNGYVKHVWPPCDLNADGSAIDPLPCGHRRPYGGPGPECKECRRMEEQRVRLNRNLG